MLPSKVIKSHIAAKILIKCVNCLNKMNQNVQRSELFFAGCYMIMI